MYVYGVDVDLCIHVPLSHWGIHSGAVLFLFIIFYYISFFYLLSFIKSLIFYLLLILFLLPGRAETLVFFIFFYIFF